MVSSVRSRPTHYETLGVAPSAGGEEIRAAFARKMSAFRWHPAGSTAQICIAYEILRDPARRRDYDLSIGIIRSSAPRQWGFAMAPQRWAPFIAAPAIDVEERVGAPTRAPAPEPHVAARPQPEPEAPGERVASSIAASLRDLARPIAQEATAPPQRQRRDNAAEAALERHIEQVLGARAADGEASGEEAERPFDWRRPALAVSGFVLAAGLIGTLAGLSVKDDAQSAQAEPVAATGRAAAKPRAPTAAAAAEAPETIAAEAKTQPPAKPPTRASHKPLPAWAERQVRPALEAAGGGDQLPEATEGAVADDPLAPRPAAARLPIPDRVVARTIERIGYACGEVASSAPVEGARGAFNVTCSSGQTFQATPVNGRYRFRRAASH